MRILIFLWIVVFALSMHTSSRSLGQLQSNPVDNIRLIRIIVMGFVALFSIGPLLSAKKINLAFKPPMVYILIYGSLALLSMTYAPNKLLTAWKSIEILVDIAVAIVIVYYFLDSGPQKFLNIVNIALGLIVIIMEIEAIFSPMAAFRWYEGGPMRRQLGGILPSMNPSMFGYVCAFACVMSLASLMNRDRTNSRIIYTLFFLSSMTGIILSHSRSVMIATSLAIVLSIFMNRRFLLLVICLIIISAVIIVPQSREYWMRTQAIEDFTDMTGRVSYWPTVWRIAKESPIYGYGFYSAQRMLLDSDTTDNFFLDVFIGLGIIGVALILFMLIAVWLDCIRFALFSYRMRKPELLELSTKIISVMLVLSIITVTGRGFSIHGEAFMMFMTLIICIHSLKHGNCLDTINDEDTEQMEVVIQS